ncbi:MAG: outer membrane lipoprotein-sorting protein [Elusimicrobiota bacterium]
MNKKKCGALLTGLVLALSAVIFSNSAVVTAAELTGPQVLSKLDSASGSPKDQEQQAKIIIIDKDGKEKSRETLMFQKGNEKRLVRFLSPADQKGIGFLSLPNDMMYIYLPAFKKTRRIASHVKNTKFAGTDFTYEDMEAKTYSEKWDSEVIQTDDKSYVLKLTPKKGTVSDYSKLVMTVDKTNFYVLKIEHYDKAGTMTKTLTRTEFEKVGNYWIANASVMEDHKNKHKTKMVVSNTKVDAGISDDVFTERYLVR